MDLDEFNLDEIKYEYNRRVGYQRPIIEFKAGEEVIVQKIGLFTHHQRDLESDKIYVVGNSHNLWLIPWHKKWKKSLLSEFDDDELDKLVKRNDFGSDNEKQIKDELIQIRNLLCYLEEHQPDYRMSEGNLEKLAGE